MTREDMSLPFGSSPRGRGTLASVSFSRFRVRFIPAWAGNTTTRSSPAPRSTVHPRVGGEHPRDEGKTNTTTGSSPRGRGTQRLQRLGQLRRGSSPRGRGTPGTPSHASAASRFIPAWAGNTRCGRTARALPSVHPRVGGEHWLKGPAEGETVGSSPRGRGTPDCCSYATRTLRFIPAWAGNTPARLTQRLTRSVHPRVGGEHRAGSSPSRSAGGSSPRGRGTPEFHCAPSATVRFIPAWAGNTR